MQRYFFLRTRYEKKRPVVDKKGVKKEKSVYTCKLDKREDFIKKFGQAEFDRICLTDKHWEELKDIPIPKGFNWLFGQFIAIRNYCVYDFNGNIIFTPRQILDYSECLGIEFTFRERQTLLAMNSWAEEIVSKIRKESEDDNG